MARADAAPIRESTWRRTQSREAGLSIPVANKNGSLPKGHYISMETSPCEPRSGNLPFRCRLNSPLPPLPLCGPFDQQKVNLL